MGPRPSLLLVLGLCLVRTVHTQEGFLPKPSIRAEPGPVIRWGQPVTIVCRGPAWADAFRLEVETRRSFLRDQRHASPHGSNGTEARFPIDAVSDDSAGSYRCYYRKGSGPSAWSARSEPLQLKVADEDAFPPPSGAPGVVSSTPLTRSTPPSTAAVTQTPVAPDTRNYTVGNYVCIGLAAVVLLILVAIVAEAGHSWRRWPHGPQGWTQGSS